jgi:hypothetical protein
VSRLTVFEADRQLVQLFRANLQLPLPERLGAMLRLKAALKLLPGLQPHDQRLEQFWCDHTWVATLASMMPGAHVAAEHWQQALDDVVEHLTQQPSSSA